ncbi:MAG: ROK family transcriptional regulator [Acetanaerobacterium sp.]
MAKSGANNLQVRNTNIKRIVNLLYQTDGMTNLAIANALHLSMPTVSQIIKELNARGLVRDAGTLASSGGRKPALNALAYDARFSLGIELTRNHIRFVVVNLAGDALYYRRMHESFCSDEAYFQRLGALLEQFLSENHIDRQRLLGVGLAVPGIVQSSEGILEYVPTLDVKGLPISSLTRHIAYPSRVENEAKLAGFAEIWRMGSLNDAVFLSVNKGVGGAVIINDKLYTGRHFRSGEFGHMTIVKDGKRCDCGKNGCLEAYCSTTELTQDDFADLDGFFAELEKQNPLCVKRWDTYCDYLAAGINNIRMIFDTDVIIGGEIDRYLEKNLDTFVQRLRALNSFSDDTPYLHISRYGGKASAIGAALLLVDEFLNS